MGLVLEFDELESGAQVGIQSTDRGTISGHAVANGGGGAAAGFVVVEVTEASHNFNGDGSGGAEQIFPLTIIQQVDVTTAGLVFKLELAGTEIGWLVAFNIEGADAGEVTINDQDDVALAIISVANPGATFNNLPYPVCFRDVDGWRLLRCRILVS